MNPEVYKKHIANGGFPVGIPLTAFNIDGSSDKTRAIGSILLGALAQVWTLREAKRFFKDIQKEKYLQRMTYCRTKKKRIHAYKKKSSYYCSLA